MFHLNTRLRLFKKSLSNLATLDESLDTLVRYNVVKQRLADSILHSSERGITPRNASDPEIVVSLTSHGQRIWTVPYTIESVFAQTYKPNRVVLYLGEEEFSKQDLPLALIRQKDRGLDVRYVADIGPHTKLIPALGDFPEAVIITIDDDYMYPLDLIERLMRAHKSNPGAVCCSQSRILKKKDSGEMMPYDSYELCLPNNDFRSHSLLAEGFGGVLYPPHSLSEEVFNVNLMSELSPYADDIWFKAMELVADTPVVQIARNMSWFNTITSETSVQDMGLKLYNNFKRGNDVQMQRLFSFFGLNDKIK